MTKVKTLKVEMQDKIEEAMSILEDVASRFSQINEKGCNVSDILNEIVYGFYNGEEYIVQVCPQYPVHGIASNPHTGTIKYVFPKYGIIFDVTDEDWAKCIAKFATGV